MWCGEFLFYDGVFLASRDRRFVDALATALATLAPRPGIT